MFSQRAGVDTIDAVHKRRSDDGANGKTKYLDDWEWMSVDDLPYDARVRYDHAGEWIAWNQELTVAVATGLDPLAVRTAAINAGTEHPVMEWVPPMYSRPARNSE